MICARFYTLMAFAMLIASAEGQPGGGEEFSNRRQQDRDLLESSSAEIYQDRRQQARGAFLTRPQGIYLHYCAHCHGNNGKGGGRLWTTELAPRPADLTRTQLDQADLVKFIIEGSAASGRESNFCPPWGRTISPPNVERLARYVISLRLPGQPAPSPEPETPASEPETQPVGARFPWILLGVVLAEVVLLVWMVLAWMVQRKRGSAHVLPEDPAVR